MARPGVVGCDECLRIKSEAGIEPDCEQCPNPELLPENEIILSLWRIVADQRDFNGALRYESVLKVLEAYEATIDDFEMIIAFDRAYREEARKYQEQD